MSKCYEKKNEIVNDLKIIFSDVDIFNKKKNHSADKTGNSKNDQTIFSLKNEEVISVSCTDWSKALNAKGWTDELKVSILSNALVEFINNEAYN